MTDSDDEIRRGYINGFSCYLLWGLLPIYFKAMGDIAPLELVAQRIMWSVVFLLAFLLFRREVPALLSSLGNRLHMRVLTVTALLIGTNWLLYVWAVANAHIIAASLGYFLNPLVSVALGVIFLKERLRPMQVAAIVFALAGVVILAFSALDTLWISLVLAVSFAIYGLVRKVAPVEALPGLTLETLVLLPLAGGYIVWLTVHGQADFGQRLSSTLLLPLSGVVTSVPLLLFTRAARRLPLATMGLLQYVAPSIQFFLGLLLYGEPLDAAKLFSFVLIWAGLAIFTADALRDLRRREAARRAASG